MVLFRAWPLLVFGDLGGNYALPDADEPVGPGKFTLDAELVFFNWVLRANLRVLQNS